MSGLQGNFIRLIAVHFIFAACQWTFASESEPLEQVLEWPVNERPTCWTARADAVWLTRTNGDRIVLGEQRTPGATPALVAQLTTHDFQYAYEPGFRVFLTRELDDVFSLEGGYLGTNHWTARSLMLNQNLGAPNQIFSTGLVANTVGFATTNSISANFSSEIHSAELNVRWSDRESPWDRIVGFRYFHVDDNLAIEAQGTGPAVDPRPPFDRTTIHTGNDLIGFQLGGDWLRAFGRLQLQLEGKAGLMLNFNRQRVQEQTNLNVAAFGLSQNPVNVRGRKTSLAGFLEATFTGQWMIREGLVIRGGYQLLMLSGVALAPGQLDLLGNAAVVGAPVQLAAAKPIDESVLILHGAFVGLEGRW